jgi:hypothetical protein
MNNCPFSGYLSMSVLPPERKNTNWDLSSTSRHKLPEKLNGELTNDTKAKRKLFNLISRGSHQSSTRT